MSSTDREKIQRRLKSWIESHLFEIEDVLGPDYKITLVCRYTPEDGKDADIVMSKDDFDKAIDTIQKMRTREEIR